MKEQYIPAPLKSAVKGGYVTDASELLDKTKNKRQNVINQETDNEISGIKGGSTKSIADLSEDIADEVERASGVEAGLRESIDELGQIGLDPENAISTDGDDFDGDTLEKRSKIPTIGAIKDGADDEPTVGSDNLVKSGGVAEAVDNDSFEYQFPSFSGLPNLNTENGTLYFVGGRVMTKGSSYNVEECTVQLKPTDSAICKIAFNTETRQFISVDGTSSSLRDNSKVILVGSAFTNSGSSYGGIVELNVPFPYTINNRNVSAKPTYQFICDSIPVLDRNAKTLTFSGNVKLVFSDGNVESFSNLSFTLYIDGNSKYAKIIYNRRTKTFISRDWNGGIQDYELLIGGVKVLGDVVAVANFPFKYDYSVNINDNAFHLLSNTTPNINTKTSTLDLGSEAIVVIGKNRYNLSSIWSSDTDKFRKIPLQGSESSLQNLIFNVATKEFRTGEIGYSNFDIYTDIMVGTIKATYKSAAPFVPTTIYSVNLPFDVLWDGKRRVYPGIIATNQDIETKLKNGKRAFHDFVTTGTTPFSIIHFSDLHGTEINVERVMNFYNQYEDYINDILQSGDNIRNSYADSYAFMNDYGAQKILGCIGNHEVLNGSSNITSLEAYDKYFKPFISNWDVVSPSDAATVGKCYYYKDYSANNVRLIVVDCMNWDTVQKTWFEGVLASTPSTYHVVAVSHFAPFVLNKFDCPFTSKDNNPVWHYLNNEAADAVDSYINNGGNFVCWLCGHEHADYIGTGVGHSNQIAVLVATAGISGTMDMERTINTKSQDCFNVVFADTYKKEFKIVRVGADYDRLLRYKNVLSVDYENKAILCQ